MIAFENMVTVEKARFEFVPHEQWNWHPDVKDPSQINRSFIEASGGNTTSRNTFTTQMDHGETY